MVVEPRDVASLPSSPHMRCLSSPVAAHLVSSPTLALCCFAAPRRMRRGTNRKRRTGRSRVSTSCPRWLGRHMVRRREMVTRLRKPINTDLWLCHRGGGGCGKTPLHPQFTEDSLIPTDLQPGRFPSDGCSSSSEPRLMQDLL